MNTTSEQYQGDGVAREPITMEDTEQPQRNDRKRPEAMEEMEAASGDTRPEIPACADPAGVAAA